jgi:hypothetical protein
MVERILAAVARVEAEAAAKLLAEENENASRSYIHVRDRTNEFKLKSEK